MTWVRFDDCAIDHPKFLALSASAFRLWFEGMAFCNKHLTDGMISRIALNGFRYSTRARVEELVIHGLWDRHDVGFKVHDYLDWNENRETVLKRREAAKSRVSDKRSRERSHEQLTNTRSGVVLLSTELSEVRKEGLEGFEQFWAVYPKRTGRLAAMKAWQAIAPEPAFIDRIVGATERYAAHVSDWEARYVKAPRNWLEGGHWDDQLTSRAAPRPTWECPHEPPCIGKSPWECKRDWDLEQARKARTA